MISVNVIHYNFCKTKINLVLTKYHFMKDIRTSPDEIVAYFC